MWHPPIPGQPLVTKIGTQSARKHIPNSSCCLAILPLANSHSILQLLVSNHARIRSKQYNNRQKPRAQKPSAIGNANCRTSRKHQLTYAYLKGNPIKNGDAPHD